MQQRPRSRGPPRVPNCRPGGRFPNINVSRPVYGSAFLRPRVRCGTQHNRELKRC